MKLIKRVFVVLVSVVVFYHSAVAADKPSDLVVGRWRDRAEPDDAVIEFLKDGTGAITETTSKQTTQVGISWKVSRTFGNACIIIAYKVPNPEEVKPMTWLVVFDGKNTFVTQPMENKIAFMDRQKSRSMATENKPR